MHCWSCWCGQPPTWAPCSTTCVAIARRSPVCSEQEPPALSSAPPPPSPPTPRPLLVVADEPHIGLLLRPPLEQLGDRVSLAKNLPEARAAAPRPAARPP